jgi:hypothetical protein
MDTGSLFLHDGQECRASWHAGSQNEIEKQLKISPKRQITNAISPVSPPISYWTIVITYWWHLGHGTSVGLWPKNGVMITECKIGSWV